jgi:uncharacterized protein
MSAEAPVRRFFDSLARGVTARPVAVLAAVVVVTLGLGYLNGQMVNDDTVAVDNELSRALETIGDEFGEGQSVLQVVVRTEDGSDVRSADGLRASLAIQDALRGSEVADTLIEGGQQPPIASYLGGAEQAVQQAGLDPADLTDEQVRQLQADALEQLPPQVAALFDGLVGQGDPPSTALILVFQATDDLDEDTTLARQQQLAAVVDAVEVPDGIVVEPFSFGLLLGGSDIGPEVGRLFGTALLIILVVLGLVYWLRPEAGQRWRIGRRTAADVGLTLVVIVLAVVWLQGIGVLLGPDYLGVIGYFSPQTQIVPILIVGLGVDFAIHLLARYRSEAAATGDPTVAFGTAYRTVGLTLLLCTAATAIGFLTNLANPVDFLATLGVLAAAGIVSAFVLTLTFLPAARFLLDRRATRRGRLPVAALGSQRESTLPQVVGRTAWLAERVPVATLAVALVLVVVGGYGFTQLDSEFELTDFVPQDDPGLATFEVIQAEFNGGFEESTDVLLTGDVATPDAHDAQVEALARVGDLDDVETLGDQADATSVVSLLGQAFADEALAGRLAQAGVQDDLTVADDADVAAVYRLLLDEVPGADEVLAETDGGWLARVQLRTSAGQDGAGPLADGLREAFAPVEATGVEVVATSQQIVQARIGEDIEDSQLLSLLIALGAAMLLLVVHYSFASRKPLVGVLTVLPVGLVLALTFGTMSLTGIPLNPVTATLAALSIGIGVPFTIHVTSRFLEERERGLLVGADGGAAASPIRRTLTQTGGALAGSALTTAIGFGVLITSTLKPFEQLGYVIVYAIAYSLVAALLVLPSLLVLWDRRDRRRHGDPAGERQRADAPVPSPAS